MRALVTGASGFVGRHLVAHLVASGDVVVSADRADGVDVCDAGVVAGCVAEAGPEVVYHLAAQSDVGGSWGAVHETFRVNVEGTVNVVLACRDAGVGRVVVVTSADIYGRVAPGQLPLGEEAALAPVSPYAASKAAADLVCVQAWLGWGVPVVRARSFNHLGPGQSTRFVAAAIASRVAAAEAAGGEVVAVGNLSPRRDFTDVRDVVRAYRLLATHGEPGVAYNVCSGTDISIQELAERLVGLARRRLRLVTDPALARPVDLAVLRGDPTRLQVATGWAPRIPLEQTLADLLADCRQRLAVSPSPGGDR